MTEYKRVLIQPGERRRSTGHKINSVKFEWYLSEKYKPLWKCSKRFIPPQTDGMIRFYFNICCSESKVIFKWRKNNNLTTTTTKKALQGANLRTSCISLSLSQNSYRTTQINAGDIRDKQKLAQNVFTPWRPTMTSRSLQSIAQPFHKCFREVLIGLLAVLTFTFFFISFPLHIQRKT